MMGWRQNGLPLAWSLLVAAMVVARVHAAEAPIEGRLSEGRYLQFMAIGVRGLAVGDTQQKLAIAFAAGRPLRACLLDLSARGDLATGVPLALPLPAVGGAAGIVGEPVAVLFHPKLPLLYLWRRRGAEAAKIETFDHLVVFDIADAAKPQVVATACTGEAYQAELLPAALALDPRARRLYLPNLQQRRDAKTFGNALGFLALDEQGLPVVRPGGEPAVTIADTGEVTRSAAGNGLVAIGDRMLLTGGWRGILYWDTNNRLAAMNGIAFADFPRDEVLLTADDRWIYAASPSAGVLRCIRHVNGFPTLLPESHAMANAVFRTAPVLMGGPVPALAIVGDNKLHVAGLTPAGEFSQQDQTIPVSWLAKETPPVYSRRFNRLYIPVEGWP